MSKFFVQLLLSVIVGVSAAFGFSPRIKGELHEAAERAKVVLHETVDTVAENVGELAAHVRADAAIKAKAESSTEDHAKTEIRANSKLTAEIDAGDASLANPLPELWVNGAFMSETRTTAEADTPDVDVKVTDKIKSALDLEVDPD